MKLNKRLLVTSGLLLALSTVATSTATYAWFTVNRTASAATLDISVSTGADLEYKLESTGGQTATGWISGTALSIKGGSLRDISGNGVNFYKPTFASDNHTITAMETISSGTDSYVEAEISFRSTSAYNVLLGTSTDIKESNSSTKALCNAARVAIFSGSVATGNLSQVIVANKETPYAHIQGITPSDSGDEAYYYINNAATCVYDQLFEGEPSSRVPAPGYGVFDNNKVILDSTIVTPTKMSDVASSSHNTLVKLAAGDAYTPTATGVSTTGYYGSIVIRIWLEGCDFDCKAENIQGKFQVILNFVTISDDVVAD